MSATAPAPTSQPAEVPPFVGDPSALVIVDWSNWLHKAWAIADVGMLSHVVGWLCAMLSHSPAHVALALDSPPPTHRHRMQHPTDPDWRYKGDRPPKPEDFFAVCAKATEIAEMHAIPCLWADGYEADDVIATVIAQARALGYRGWIVTCDKDLHGILEEDMHSGVTVGTWDPFLRSWRGPAEVRAKWGVEPYQMADLLGIAGDPGDGVPGVDGLGMGKAAAILSSRLTLDAALTMMPAQGAAVDIMIRQEVKARAERKKAGGADIGGPQIKAMRALLPSAWKEMSGEAQAIERDIVKLHEHEVIARFSRDLTALDCDAPVDVPWEQIPIGGFDVEALRKRYVELGYVRKASEVPNFAKRAAWALPRR